MVHIVQLCVTQWLHHHTPQSHDTSKTQRQQFSPPLLPAPPPPQQLPAFLLTCTVGGPLVCLFIFLMYIFHSKYIMKQWETAGHQNVDHALIPYSFEKLLRVSLSHQ